MHCSLAPASLRVGRVVPQPSIDFPGLSWVTSPGANCSLSDATGAWDDARAVTCGSSGGGADLNAMHLRRQASPIVTPCDLYLWRQLHERAVG